MQVRVTQVFRAERTIVVDVPSAQDAPSAVEAVASGAFDLPEFDAPGWQTSWELMNEEHGAV